MSFLRKMTKKHGPAEPASSEQFVMVHVGDGDPQFDAVLMLPASHLLRPRLAPLVATAEEDDHQEQDNDVIRIKCRFSEFAEAMARTAVEEAAEGRTACGWVVDPSDKLPGPLLLARHHQAQQTLLRWMLVSDSCDAAIRWAAAEVINTWTQILRQSCNKTASPAEDVTTGCTKKSTATSAPDVPTKSLTMKTWHQKMIQRMRIVPSPETPLPPPAISFRPTWCKHMSGLDPGPLLARHHQAQQALLQLIMDPAACDAAILDAAVDEVIHSRTPAQLRILRESCKTTTSSSADAVSMSKSAPAVPTNSLAVKATWRRRMSGRLRILPSPKTPPPPPPFFRPTWARNRRTSVSGSQ